MPIQVNLDTGVYATEVTVPITPAPIVVPNAKKLDKDFIQQCLDDACCNFGNTFEKALENDDLNGAHNAWCDIGIDFLIKMSGKAPPKDPKGAPRRGRAPVLEQQRLAVVNDGHLYGAQPMRLHRLTTWLAGAER